MIKVLQATAACACLAIAVLCMYACALAERASTSLDITATAITTFLDRTQQDIRMISIRAEHLLQTTDGQVAALAGHTAEEILKLRLELQRTLVAVTEIGGRIGFEAVNVANARSGELVTRLDGRLGEVTSQAAQTMRSAEPALANLVALEAETIFAVRETREKLPDSFLAFNETNRAAAETIDELRPSAHGLLLDLRVSSRGVAKKKLRPPLSWIFR